MTVLAELCETFFVGHYTAVQYHQQQARELYHKREQAQAQKCILELE